ncbi:MAG TPA: type II secretion system protein [Planctomycetota bacterium]|nr:type II secretion system protein [Planctomycetota bacterium]
MSIDADTAGRESQRARERGFSLVEVAIAVLLVPLVLGIGFLSLQRSGKISASVVESTTSMDKLRRCLRQIGDELLSSSQTGEDSNGNGVLDAGEDTNGNARLEKDWLVSAKSITFNRVRPNGTWSLPITYKLQSGQLMRSELLSTGKTETVSVAGQVLAFAVLVSGRQVTVSLSVGTDNPQSSSITVMQRN